MQPSYPASPRFRPDDPRRVTPNAHQGYQGFPLAPDHTGMPQRRPDAVPRLKALLCYSIPLVPGAWLLWRARHQRFLRFHAAQSLVFFTLIALGQIAIWSLLLVAGGLVQNIAIASGVAVVVVALFLALGVGALLVWLRLAGDCLDGRMRRLPLAGAWAARLERLVTRPPRR